MVDRKSYQRHQAASSDSSPPAGTQVPFFHPVDEQRTCRWARDSARRNSSTGTDSTRSERLADLVQAGWMIRTKGMSTSDNADQLLRDAGVEESELDAAVDRLHEVACQWHELGIGELLTLDWPWPEQRRPRERTTTCG
jgi:hypothetical protein